MWRLHASCQLRGCWLLWRYAASPAHTAPRTGKLQPHLICDKYEENCLQRVVQVTCNNEDTNEMTAGPARQNRALHT
jgi:hypothetical protein